MVREPRSELDTSIQNSEVVRTESSIDIVTVRDAKGWNKSFSKKFNETMDLAANDAMVGFAKTMSAAAHYAKALKMAQQQGKGRQAVVEEFRYRVKGKLDKDQIYHILNWEKRVEGSRQRRLAEKAKIEEIHKRWQEQEIKEKERLELEAKVRIDTKAKEPININIKDVKVITDQEKAKFEELEKSIKIEYGATEEEFKKAFAGDDETFDIIQQRMIVQLNHDKRRLFDTIAEKDKIIAAQKKEIAKPKPTVKEQPEPKDKDKIIADLNRKLMIWNNIVQCIKDMTMKPAAIGQMVLKVLEPDSEQVKIWEREEMLESEGG